VEPYVNLLIANISTIDCKVLTSKLSFTRFIWHNFLIHDEVKLEMCSLYDKFESNVVPRSLADVTVFIVCFKKFTDIFSGKFCNMVLEPIRRNLVLFWLISNWCSNHHMATLRRSFSNLIIVVLCLSYWRSEKGCGRRSRRRRSRYCLTVGSLECHLYKYKTIMVIGWCPVVRHETVEGRMVLRIQYVHIVLYLTNSS
jgi:hypothetical protein